MERRYEATRAMMRDRGVDALVVYGDAGFAQANVRWLTNYAPSYVTYLVFFQDEAEPSLLLCGLSNHLQYVREVSEADAVDVLLPNPPSKVVDRLRAGGVDGGTVGIVGHSPRYALSIPHPHYETLTADLDAVLVDATAGFEALLAVKSESELDRIRRAAALTDRALEALRDAIKPGVRETDLRDALTRTYLESGGAHGMAFITAAPMADAEPGEGLPWHRPSGRQVERGDVVTTEMSASYRGYRSQVHRAFAVGQSPTAEYEALWDVAAATYESMLAAIEPGATATDVHRALEPIEASPYKLYDVALHGYGSGYHPPFVGTSASNYWPGGEDPVTAGWTFETDQVVVVQPNVVTADERCGLQLGSAVVVRDGGPEVLQAFPVAFEEA